MTLQEYINKGLPLEVGQMLIESYNEGNPFAVDRIKITDLKDGWVQYVWVFSDTTVSKGKYSRSLEDLLSIFTPLEK